MAQSPDAPARADIHSIRASSQQRSHSAVRGIASCMGVNPLSQLGIPPASVTVGIAEDVESPSKSVAAQPFPSVAWALSSSREVGPMTRSAVRRPQQIWQGAGGRDQWLPYASGVIEIGSRARKLPAPPLVVWRSLTEPRRPQARPWLNLLPDEVEPRILEAAEPTRVVWSSLPRTRARPDTFGADSTNCSSPTFGSLTANNHDHRIASWDNTSHPSTKFGNDATPMVRHRPNLPAATANPPAGGRPYRHHRLGTAAVRVPRLLRRRPAARIDPPPLTCRRTVIDRIRFVALPEGSARVAR